MKKIVLMAGLISCLLGQGSLGAGDLKGAPESRLVYTLRTMLDAASRKAAAAKSAALDFLNSRYQGQNPPHAPH